MDMKLMVKPSIQQFPNKILTSKFEHQEAVNWCNEHFGDRWSVTDNRDGTWYVFWAGPRSWNNYEWFFKNEQDALLFALRWI